jgi:hypothetical protein
MPKSVALIDGTYKKQPPLLAKPSDVTLANVLVHLDLMMS